MADGHINIVFGWAWMCIGFLSGMVLGLRAEGEGWLGGYAALPRRYLRLAHVAFIALPIINILYGHELGSTDLAENVRSIGAALMVFGAVGIPLTCLAAAFKPKTKYFFPLPASALLVGAVIMVVGLL